eukprot:12323543-Heterocapsa_arctica.AAC.2
MESGAQKVTSKIESEETCHIGIKAPNTQVNTNKALTLTRLKRAKKNGYIMFEDLGNKDETNRTQEVHHAYCMENKIADKEPKVNDKPRTEQHRLHEPKIDKRSRACRKMIM